MMNALPCPEDETELTHRKEQQCHPIIEQPEPDQYSADEDN